MKKILFIMIIILLVIVIYLGLQDKKVYYVSLSDNLLNKSIYTYKNYIVDYLSDREKLETYVDISNEDYRVIDIIQLIKDNAIIQDKAIENILIKADFITLSIGNNDILTKLKNYDSNKYDLLIDNYITELDELLSLLRKYCKEKIVMLGYYNIYEATKYDDKIKYLNNLTKELCSKYDIDFIDISNISTYLNNEAESIEGNHLIFNIIRKVIDKYILE